MPSKPLIAGKFKRQVRDFIREALVLPEFRQIVEEELERRKKQEAAKFGRTFGKPRGSK